MDGTIRTELKSLGYDSDVMTAHGFRSTASTLLNEQDWSPDAIEQQLAHGMRFELLITGTQYLDNLKKGAVVLPFRQTA